MTNRAKIKIGLAFSGGGARGLAHVGGLKVLEDAGIAIDCISGTSMGGVIAAAYACGIPVCEIEERALGLAHMHELIKLLDVSPLRRGLLEGDRIRDYMAEMFLDRHFENLPVRLALPAVDLVEAREIVFTSGLVLPAVLATIAVPGLLPPMEIGPYHLVDGGILNNLPVDRVHELGADIVIAIDAQFDPYTEKPWQDLPVRPRFPIPLPDFFLDFYRAELIMIAQITQAHLKVSPPDLLLHPPIPPDIDIFLGFPRIPEVIAAGEASAREALPEILRLIDG
jgi:NTE family protein